MPSLNDTLARHGCASDSATPLARKISAAGALLAEIARRYGQARSARIKIGLVVLLTNLEGHIRPPPTVKIVIKIFGLHVHGLLLVSDRLPIKASTVFITFDAESVFVAIPAVFPGRLAH